MSEPRIPPTEVTGVLGALVKRMARRRLGDVPESIGVLWHNTTVLKDMSRFGQKAEAWDACDKSLKSFAHMAVASLVGCSFCLDFGYFAAHDAKLDLRKASQVPRWRESDVFTPLERDVLEYAEAMTQTTSAVTDELSSRLLAALGPAALIELTAFIAFANATSRSNTALGIGSEGYSRVCEIPLASRPGTTAPTASPVPTGSSDPTGSPVPTAAA